MRPKDSNLEEAVEHAARGEFKEYWLQQYIKKCYRGLGFDSISGPFEKGCDFSGVYQGEKVAVEAETRSRNFLYHRHDPRRVDILVVLNDDTSGEVLGMKPIEWRERLPKKIIVVDPEDFVKETHTIRKEYALKKREERRVLESLFSFFRIKRAFARLWGFLIEEVPYEGTAEVEAFEGALVSTAVEYIKFYDIDLDKLREELMFTRIEVLAKRESTNLADEEKEFLSRWLSVLHTEYVSRI